MYIYYLFFALVSFSSFLFCMEKDYCNKINCLILSHDDICTWALVDTYFNKKIQDTAESRKEYLKKSASSYNEKEVIWHKYGSAYLQISKKETNKGTNNVIGLAYLRSYNEVCDALDNGLTFDSKFSEFLNEKAIPGNLFQAYFNYNYKREIYFYAIRVGSPDCCWDTKRYLLKCILSTKNTPRQYPCLIRLPKSDPVNIASLLCLSNLVGAFLESTRVCRTQLRMGCGMTCFPCKNSIFVDVFDLKGVTIPPDFKKVESSVVQSHYKQLCNSSKELTFEDFYPFIKDPIIAKYDKQQHEKF